MTITVEKTSIHLDTRKASPDDALLVSGSNTGGRELAFRFCRTPDTVKDPYNQNEWVLSDEHVTDEWYDEGIRRLEERTSLGIKNHVIRFVLDVSDPNIIPSKLALRIVAGPFKLGDSIDLGEPIVLPKVDVLPLKTPV